jgi:hypothetical protein
VRSAERAADLELQAAALAAGPAAAGTSRCSRPRAGTGWMHGGDFDPRSSMPRTGWPRSGWPGGRPAGRTRGRRNTDQSGREALLQCARPLRPQAAQESAGTPVRRNPPCGIAVLSSAAERETGCCWRTSPTTKSAPGRSSPADPSSTTGPDAAPARRSQPGELIASLRALL